LWHTQPDVRKHLLIEAVGVLRLVCLCGVRSVILVQRKSVSLLFILAKWSFKTSRFLVCVFVQPFFFPVQIDADEFFPGIYLVQIFFFFYSAS